MPTTSRENAQVNSYRKAAERIEDAETLPVGPAPACPACGLRAIADYELVTRATDDGGREQIQVTMGRVEKSPLPDPVACSPVKRVRVGLFRNCKIDGSHLHERCKVCGHQWLTAFAGGQ